jgi:N-acetylmuramoyl-L-alanine amidase
MRPRGMDVLTMAKTLWGEARSEGYQGMLAVAWVIKNRASRPSWWGDTITEVCLKPSQFSCWNSDDPNRRLLDNLTIDDDQYLIAVGIAHLVVAGVLSDPTNGATHYFTKRKPVWAKVWPPAWSTEMPQVAEIGRHVFFRDPQVGAKLKPGAKA